MGDQNEKVLFGAEFEGDGMTKGVDAVVANLEKMNQAQDKNKEVLKQVNKEITDNEKALAKLEKQQKAVINTDSDYYRQLSTSVDNLKKKNEDLHVTLDKTRTKFREQGREMVEQRKVINQSTRDHEALGKSIEKFTNINHLAAEGVGLFRRRIVDVGYSMIAGFAGGIVSQVLPALTDFITNLFSSTQALDDFDKRQLISSEIQNKAVDGYIKQTTHLELIRAKLTDLTIPQSERLKLLTEYNKIADKGNQIDKTQIDNLGLINVKIFEQIELIKKRALARAAENIISEKAEKFLKTQFELEEKFPEFSDQTISKSTRNIQDAIDRQSKALKLTGKISVEEALAFVDIPEDQLKSIAEKDKRFSVLLDSRTNNIINTVKGILNKIGSARAGNELFTGDFLGLQKAAIEAKEDFDRALSIGLGFIDVDSLTTKPGKDPKDKKAPENVFEQMLAALKARLATAMTKSFNSEPLIQTKFEQQLNKEFTAIEKLVTDKKLTGPQSDILKALITQINSIDLEKELTDFRKKQTEAMKKIDDAITSAQVDAANKRIENIRDDFEREKAVIEQGYKNTTTTLTNSLKSLVEKVNNDVDAGLISNKEGKKRKTLASLIFGDLLESAGQAETNKQLDLSFKMFERTVADANVMFEKMQLKNDQKTAQSIQNEKTAYAKGTINYAEFQKRVTEILRLQKEERDRIRLLELNTDRLVFQKRLEATEDPDQKKILEKKIRDIDKEIAAINSQVDKNDPGKKRFEQFKAYVASLSSLLGTIVSFWNQVNQTEQAALDRSIALQDRRVENARLIAEKGNAEYLELEQKRLDELTRKREENARRQLAINNALTLSQALVAAITAIAQAASGGGGIAAIAAVAAVIGAIAAAYSFVSSLQPQTTGFFTGTESVEGPGGKDTIPARLTRGERVVTAEDNKKYWKTLSAIHNHVIPADVLNNFVANYPDTHVPVVDFDRLMSATGNKTGFDSIEVAGKLDRLDETLNVVVASIQQLGINVKLDEDGFSASLESYSRRKKIRNRS